MARLSKEDQAERMRGYRSGRRQGNGGNPWKVGEQTHRSEVYIEGHRKGYLAAIALRGIKEPTEPKSRTLKSLSDERLSDAQSKGYEVGFDEGFREALKLLKELPVKRPRGKGEWSDQKMAGYQWGYRHAKANHPPHSAGDLRSDPDFNEGYEMGYSAGSKILQSA
jgi:hypothetical protein